MPSPPLHYLPVAPAQLETLLAMQAAFYAEEGLAFAEPRARAALAGLLAEERHGQAWFIMAEQGVGEKAEPQPAAPAGYLVLTWCYSLEFGGVTAFIDELYVQPDGRGQGLGRAALGFAHEAARAHGCVRLLLEVAPENRRARELYQRVGFAPRHYQLMTRGLTDSPPA